MKIKNIVLISILFGTIPTVMFSQTSFNSLSQTPPANTLGLAADVTVPYFGQTPPGTTPQLFAPGILMQPGVVYKVTRIAFSPDGNECFFSGPTNPDYTNTRMFYTKCINNVWTTPVLAPFDLPGYSCRQPYFSANDTLYFSSSKKVYLGSNMDSSSNIWMVVRTSQGWGDPQVLPEPINSSSYDGMYTKAKDGTIYIESSRPGGFGKIDVWRVRQQPDQPQQVENLELPINTSNDDNDPFVSPDGRYVLFGASYSDLFVTFNKGDSGWTTPVNMNHYIPGINTGQEYAPVISPDGRYLFFNRGGINWVRLNTSIYVKNAIPNQSDTAGQLFSYTIPDSAFINDNGNTLSYNAKLTNGNPLPSWLHFDTITRTFSGIPLTAETLNIKVTVKDTANASISGDFKIEIKSFTGIEGLKKKVNIMISPNPSNGLITVTLRESPYKEAAIEIFDFSGKLILS